MSREQVGRLPASHGPRATQARSQRMNASILQVGTASSEVPSASEKRWVVSRFLVCILALVLSACAGAALNESEQQALAQAAAAAPKVQPGDKVRVVVFGEDKLSGDYEIDQSGQISLPLAGTIEAKGLTQAELEQALAKKFRSEYLKNPKVTVTIASLQPYYVVGEVAKPGEFPYRSGLNVMTALAIAGGPTYRASRSTVKFQRRGETTMTEYPISAAVPILPGDVVSVPERYF